MNAGAPRCAHARTRPATPTKEIKSKWRNSFDSGKIDVVDASALSKGSVTAMPMPNSPLNISESYEAPVESSASANKPSSAVLASKTMVARPKPVAEDANAALEAVHQVSELLKSAALASTPGPEPTSPIPKRISPREEFQSALQSLPLYSYKDANPSRKVSYTRQMKKSSESAERLLRDRVSVVGFDLEWKPMYTSVTYNRVSLVQIASENDIVLVQLDGSTKFPSALKAFLEEPTILKVGAGITDDAKKLLNDWQVNLRNYLDLSHLARYLDPFWDQCDASSNMVIDGAFGWDADLLQGKDIFSSSPIATVPRTPTSPKDTTIHSRGSTTSLSTTVGDDASSTLSRGDTLSSTSGSEATKSTPPSSPPVQSAYTFTSGGEDRQPIYGRGLPIALVRLVARYQGKRLDKSCQLSNWAAPLNKKQIEYAANDGCASLDIYNTLMSYRFQLASRECLRESMTIRNQSVNDSASSPQASRMPDAVSTSTPVEPSHSKISLASLSEGALNPADGGKTVEKHSTKTHYPSPPVTPTPSHRSTVTTLQHRSSPSDMASPSLSVPQTQDTSNVVQAQELLGIPQPYTDPQPTYATPASQFGSRRRSRSKNHSLSQVQGTEFMPMPPPTYVYPLTVGPNGSGQHANVDWVPSYTTAGYFPPNVLPQYGSQPQSLYTGPPPVPVSGPVPYPTPNSSAYPYPPYPQFQQQSSAWFGNPNFPNGSELPAFQSTLGWYLPPQLADPHKVQSRRRDEDWQSHALQAGWEPRKKEGVEWTGNGWIPTPMSVPESSPLSGAMRDPVSNQEEERFIYT